MRNMSYVKAFKPLFKKSIIAISLGAVIASYYMPALADDIPNVNNSYASMPLRGVSLSGAEFNENGSGWATSGKLAPTFDDADLFIYRGMNTYRIPVTWEYFADMNGNFLTNDNAKSYLQHVSSTILSILQHNGTVLIDLHNYMRYNVDDVSQNYSTARDPDDIIGVGSKAPSAAAFANLWKNIVTMVRQYPLEYQSRIMFGMMNEPHDIDMNTLVSEQNQVIKAIRDTEAQYSGDPDNMPNHSIVIDGNAWSGLHSWVVDSDDDSNGPTNASVYPSQIIDPANKIVYDVHQYFDDNSSGGYSSGDCLSNTDFLNGSANRLGFNTYWPSFKQWALDNNVKFIVGEFGGPYVASSNNCQADTQSLLDAMSEVGTSNSDNSKAGALGWVVWSAGHAWGSQYKLGVAPGGAANPFMWNNTLYQKYLTQVADLPPLGPKIAKITNNTDEALDFGGGYWPFQLSGSSILAPGSTGYLYSPTSTVAPGDQVELDYMRTIQGTSGFMGIGVDPTGDPTGQGYGYEWTDPSAQVNISATGNCDIANITNGDINNRCWSITNQSAITHGQSAKK